MTKVFIGSTPNPGFPLVDLGSVFLLFVLAPWLTRVRDANRISWVGFGSGQCEPGFASRGSSHAESRCLKLAAGPRGTCVSWPARPREIGRSESCEARRARALTSYACPTVNYWPLGFPGYQSSQTKRTFFRGFSGMGTPKGPIGLLLTGTKGAKRDPKR